MQTKQESLAVEKLAGYSVAAMGAAIDNVLLNYLPGRCPPLQKIIEIVAAEEDRINEEKRHRDIRHKSENRPVSDLVAKPQATRHGRQAVRAFKVMYDANKTPIEKLEVFGKMEHEFPGMGWAVEGKQLLKEYLRMGLVTPDELQSRHTS